VTKQVSLGVWMDGGAAAKLDVARLLITRLLVQANSGSGKSWALRRLLEATAGLVQQLIIDPEGEFATLREKHDLVIISASGGDALAHPKTAALLAQRLLETQASAVLDISDLKAHDRHSFVRLFLESLIDAPKALRHSALVVLDEAQMFCPEKGQGESEASAAVIDVATRGRKRGLCLVAATQRISMLHKGVAAECKNRMIGGTSLDVDVKRAAFDLGMPPAEALKILRALEPGHFYAFGPAFHQLQPREFVTGDVHTSHPKVGHRQAAPPAPTQAILALLPKLADLPKEAEQQAKSMEDLRRELAQTKRELTLAKKAQPVTGPSREDLKTAETSGFSRGRESGIDAALKAIAGQRKSLNAALHKAITVTLAEFDAVSDDLKLPPVAWTQPTAKPAQNIQKLFTPPAPLVRAVKHPGNGSEPSSLGKAERKILSVLAQFPDGCEIGKLTLLTGYRKSGGFLNSLSALRTAGYMEGTNTGTMRITPEGLSQGPFPELPQGDDLLRYWLEHPSFGACERKVLAALAQNPQGLAIEELCAETDYKKSGGFLNSLSALRTAGVLVGRNTETMRISSEIL
jgi:uncharacterized protein